MSFITYDDEHHRIAIIAIPGTKPKDRQTSGLEHIVFTFDSLDDLLLAYAQRKEQGIKHFWSVNHGPTLSIYYIDPDGNQLETQIDTFATSEEATAFMLGPEFRENPIGVDFDPEEVIQQLKKGISQSIITKRPMIGSRDYSTIPMIA